MKSFGPARLLLLIPVGVGLLGLGFYGGAYYENQQDQHLFAEYNPPQQGGGGGFGGGAGNSVIAAALSVGQPPVANAAGAATPAPTAPTGSTTSPKIASTGTTGATGSGAGGTAQALVAGYLVSTTGSTLTLRTLDGKTQTVPIAGTTTYYLAASVTTHALATGERVTIAGTRDAQQQLTATSVTIAPPGNLSGSVRTVTELKQLASAQASGGPGAAGGAGGSGFGGGGGFGGGAGGFGGGARGLSGTVASLAATSISVQTAQGFSLSAALTASTKVYQIAATTAAKLPTGSLVTIRTVSGQKAAASVTASSIPGMAAMLSAPRIRAFSGGGSGFGGSGGGGGFGTGQ